MSRADTLLKVKEAEVKAEKIIKEAEEQSKLTVSTAKRDAARLVQEAEVKMKADNDAAFAKEKAQISSQREEILKKGREEASKIASKASVNVPKAKNHLKERFERALDATS
ncbi:MAG: hypothetical protein MUE65_03530 [Methanomassiliicoccales archaeon]|nr:hypothetical protein [Methanomassiliicoccales archaeon]